MGFYVRIEQDQNADSMAFGNAFPEAWQRIFSTKSGQFHNANGLFAFVTVYPLEENYYHWKIVSYISPDILSVRTSKLRNRLLLFYAVLVVTIGVGSWFLANAQVSRKLVEQELRIHQDGLEGLVKDRTTELTAAN